MNARLDKTHLKSECLNSNLLTVISETLISWQRKFIAELTIPSKHLLLKQLLSC